MMVCDVDSSILGGIHQAPVLHRKRPRSSDGHSDLSDVFDIDIQDVRDLIDHDISEEEATLYSYARGIQASLYNTGFKSGYTEVEFRYNGMEGLARFDAEGIFAHGMASRAITDYNEQTYEYMYIQVHSRAADLHTLASMQFCFTMLGKVQVALKEIFGSKFQVIFVHENHVMVC
jgi:hypothetical protein